jgi:hypothetical protein
VRKSIWLWVLLAILVILVLGLVFGGYRKGAKLGAPGPLEPVAAWSAPLSTKDAEEPRHRQAVPAAKAGVRDGSAS